MDLGSAEGLDCRQQAVLQKRDLQGGSEACESSYNLLPVATDGIRNWVLQRPLKG